MNAPPAQKMRPRSRRGLYSSELHQEVSLNDLVVTIARNRPLLSRTDACDIAGSKAPIQILGQRIRIIEGQAGRQDSGQVVGSVELPSFAIEVAEVEEGVVDVGIR